MAIKNRKKRITARISALLLSAAMLCSLSACSDPVAVTKIKGTPTEAGAAESTLLHSVGDKANLQQVGKSGLIELLFDESTYSVCVADLSHDDSEKLWSALPTQENSGAATATLEIVSGDTLYKLNTQDNSVSFQNAQCNFADDALSVTYVYCRTAAQKKPRTKVRGSDPVHNYFIIFRSAPPPAWPRLRLWRAGACSPDWSFAACWRHGTSPSSPLYPAPRR